MYEGVDKRKGKGLPDTVHELSITAQPACMRQDCVGIPSTRTPDYGAAYIPLLVEYDAVLLPTHDLYNLLIIQTLD
jgi:hypothetical protein